MDAGYRYEMLIRHAFGYTKDGRTGARSCDPADLANAGELSESNLDRAKIGAGYAMTVLSSEVANRYEGTISDAEHTRISSFLGRVVAASSAKELSSLVDEFDETVFQRYFKIDQGEITLKR